MINKIKRIAVVNSFILYRKITEKPREVQLTSKLMDLNCELVTHIVG